MNLCQTISTTECVLDSIGLLILAPFAFAFVGGVGFLAFIWLVHATGLHNTRFWLGSWFKKGK